MRILFEFSLPWCIRQRGRKDPILCVFVCGERRENWEEEEGLDLMFVHPSCGRSIQRFISVRGRLILLIGCVIAKVAVLSLLT